MAKNKLPIKLIKSYQKNKQIIGTGHCRFYPSCSYYALEAYQKFNFFYASWLTIWRIIRCNPLTKRKYNPVPLTKKEKKINESLSIILSSHFNELTSCLIKHYQLYPLSQANDLIKLIYQHYYGPKHLVTNDDEPTISKYIQEEINSIKTPIINPLDFICNNYLRFDLRLIQNKDELQQLTKIFIDTCQNVVLPLYPFQDAINLLKLLINQDIIPLKNGLEEIKEYEKNVSLTYHSEAYKNSYHPHYRIINMHYLPYQVYLKALSTKVEDKLKKQDKIIIAIDGPASSGKTTLVEKFKKDFTAEIYHIDDFFLPKNLKTKKRLNEVGGNIHYERILKELIIPLKTNKPFTYQRYNCENESWEAKISQNNTKVVFIEGVYSAHPLLINHYDLLIYVDIDPITQDKRLKVRHNDHLYQKFVNEWLPLEKTYFELYNVKNKADLIISGKYLQK